MLVARMALLDFCIWTLGRFGNWGFFFCLCSTDANAVIVDEMYACKCWKFHFHTNFYIIFTTTSLALLRISSNLLFRITTTANK